MILRRYLLCAAIVPVLWCPLSIQAEMPLEPPAFALDRIRDLAASVRARRALKEDRTLASLNLGISVEEGVANVWGPVPSDAVGRRAIVLLESVRGIRSVRASFYIESPREENLLGGLTRRPEMLERFEASKPIADAETLPKKFRAMPAATPTQGSASAATPNAPQLFTPRPVAVPVRQAVSLQDSIATIRKDDGRFGNIPINIKGTVLKVQQRAGSDDVIRDLVERLRRVPGVTEVELGSD